MKIISANSDIEKLGSISRIGCPLPSDTDMTGTPCVVTTCCVESFSTRAFRPAQPPAPLPTRRSPTSTSENQAAAKTAVILMKNWTISMTSTPQRPECAAKTTFKTPQMTMVCQAGIPKRMLAILHAAKVTMPMMKQLKNSPR